MALLHWDGEGIMSPWSPIFAPALSLFRLLRPLDGRLRKGIVSGCMVCPANSYVLGGRSDLASAKMNCSIRSDRLVHIRGHRRQREASAAACLERGTDHKLQGHSHSGHLAVRLYCGIGLTKSYRTDRRA